MTRILCVDNYDSFVWTIVGYLRHLGADVDVARNDAVDARWWDGAGSAGAGPSDAAGDEGGAAPASECPYDGVLISPGPGDPKGAGASLQVIADCAERGIPMLGVCLGHQALGELFGATVAHAPELMHGRTSQITHDGRGVFRGVPSPVTVTRYHSLAVDPATVPDDLEVSAATDTGIVMGLRHRTLPLEGVQFHPESVLTEHGHLMLGNWLARCGDATAPERAAALAPMVADRRPPR
jgi:para-aminobenzoate synthetase component 2